KVVLMIRRAPRYGDKDRPFADDETVNQLASLAGKLSNAEKHKAKAILLVNDAGEKDDTLMDFGYAALGTPVAIPAVHIKRAAAERLLRHRGKSLAELEAAIDRDLKPMSAP